MSDLLLPEVCTWEKWGTIFTDESLWKPVVERVWAMDERLPAVTGIRRPDRVESGYPGTCAVFIVNHSAVIKLLPPMVAGDFEKERAVYRLIQGRVPHIPELLAEGILSDRIEWPYIVLTYLPGMAWRDNRSRIPPSNRRNVLRELGRAVSATHTTPLPLSGQWPSPAGWDEFLRDRIPRIGAGLCQHTALRESVVVEIVALLATANWRAGEPVLLHADLTEDHLLVSEHDGRWTFAGLIDWADAEVGDPGYDWVALWFSICDRDATLFQAFLEGYGLENHPDENITNRLTALTFLHRFGTNILGEVLTKEQQRAFGTLDELKQVLFGE